LTGIILIAVGVGVAAVYTEYEIFLVSKFFSIPTFLIVIGSFIIVFAFFGCWGALKENYCLILTFSVLLGLIFILELAAGISGYVLRSDAESLIKDTLSTSMKQYNNVKPNDVTSLWDYVQRSKALRMQQYYKEEIAFIGAVEFPMVLWVISVVPFIMKMNSPAAHAVSLGAAGVVIAVIQFFGVLFACYIAREIKIRNGITGFTG
ncbi:hypothetical protein DOY81_015067, partial [Sarcophaga bullata]